MRGGEGRKRRSSKVLFSFWAQLFIEHAVVPYQNHLAVADNNDVTRQISIRNHYKSPTKRVCVHSLFFVCSVLLFVVCYRLFVCLFIVFYLFVFCFLFFVFCFLLIDNQGL